MKVNINDLANVITKEVREYTREVKEGVEEVQKEVAKEGVKMLKKVSPERRPRYKKGWRTKKVGKGQVIHNATDYQLTHLLENGFVQRDGKRNPGKPHIGKVEEKVIEEYEKRVEKVIRR